MSLLSIAIGELGQTEIRGPEDNPRIVAYALETGITGITDDDTHWCSTFMNWCAKTAGLPYTQKANARSWLHVGKPVKNPVPGDVVIFWRVAEDSWEGHVGLFMGFNQNGSKVFCLGGNQADTVNITLFDASKILGFRRLAPEDTSQLVVPQPLLVLGNRGAQVRHLQNFLNHKGYNCGDADGIFGQKTQKALRRLQADHLLKVDGEYGNNTQTLVESLLQS